MPWTHRPALDGLRTLAVYLVVLYHAGLAWAGGGFIGVDLFFVLSGFLVASILMNELAETGRIRLWRFYARRVRRLLPAALVVVVSTALVFVLVTTSVRRFPLVGDAQSALLYVANWRFLLQSDNYFATDDVDRSPYLHFWSLSIEEQFYLVFPLLLIALAVAARRRPRVLVGGLGLLLVLGVAAQVVWSQVDATHAYYGTDARVYQLLAGVLAAWWWKEHGHVPDGRRRTGRPGQRAAVLAVASGGALVLLATDLLDLTPANRGLLATVAAVALVLGVMRAGETWPVRLLGRRVPAYLGAISYGTYLWHWPVTLVLLEVLDASPWVIAVLVIGLATGLASLSFHVLEHPIRSSRRLARFAPAIVAAGLGASLVVAVLVPTVLESSRRPVLAVDQVAAGRGPQVPAGIDWKHHAQSVGLADDVYCTDDDTTSCVVREGGSGLSVALVGDSHARMIAPVMEALAEEHDFTLSLDVQVACPWQHQIASDGEGRETCRESRDDLYSTLLSEMDVDVVVLAQRARDRGVYAEAGARAGYDQAEFDSFNAAAMRETLGEIGAQGADAVMIRPVLEVPESAENPLECLAAARFQSQCAVPVPAVATPTDGFQATLGSTVDGAAAITLNDLVCPDAPLCRPMRGDLPVWRNHDHLTTAFLLELSDQIWDRLESTGFFEE